MFKVRFKDGQPESIEGDDAREVAWYGLCMGWHAPMTADERIVMMGELASAVWGPLEDDDDNEPDPSMKA